MRKLSVFLNNLIYLVLRDKYFAVSRVYKQQNSMFITHILYFKFLGLLSKSNYLIRYYKTLRISKTFKHSVMLLLISQSTFLQRHWLM